MAGTAQAWNASAWRAPKCSAISSAAACSWKTRCGMVGLCSSYVARQSAMWSGTSCRFQYWMIGGSSVRCIVFEVMPAAGLAGIEVLAGSGHPALRVARQPNLARRQGPPPAMPAGLDLVLVIGAADVLLDRVRNAEEEVVLYREGQIGRAH